TTTPSTSKPDRAPTSAAPTASAAPAAADPPTLRLVETATCGTPPGPCASVSAAGDTITYTYFVTNASDDSIADITVTDHRPGPTTVTIDCHASPNPNPLPPFGTATCSSTYTVTANDVAAGSILDTATANGTDVADGSPVASSPYSVSVDVRPPLPGFTAALVNTNNTLELVGSPATDTACSEGTSGGNLCLLGLSGNVLSLGSSNVLHVDNDIWWNSNSNPAASNGNSAPGSVTAIGDDIEGLGPANNRDARWSPLPETSPDFPTRDDPFATEPEPPPDPSTGVQTEAEACALNGTEFRNSTGPATVNPGVYNFMDITGGAVTLDAGVYTIKQYVAMSGSSGVTGNGVTLYFCTGAGGSGSGNSGRVLSSEGSGTRIFSAAGGSSGFAIFFARNIACTNGSGGLQFLGSSRNEITGRVYAVSTGGSSGCGGALYLRARPAPGGLTVHGDVVVQRVDGDGILTILRG
ncbi:MAG: hypothetical protein J2P17_29385, partial [Mycobacterium sp.]|nr:hypothetical protein [Mycobacterium sp.]